MPAARLVLLFALAVPLAAAPVPKDFKKTLPVYFPLNSGDEWVYKYGEQEVRVVTRDVTDKDGVKTGTLVTYSGEREMATETIRVDRDGVHRTHINNVAVDPPLTMVSFDPKRENRWAVQSKVQASELAGTYEVASRDEIEVPAGTFKAVNVVGDLKIGGTPVVIKYWFAEGVGQVKVAYTLARSEQAMVLKAYNPAKKEKK